MLSLQFQPLNDPARSTFSQLVCARKMAAEILDAHASHIETAKAELAGRIDSLVRRLEGEGEVVGHVTRDCAYAQLGPAVSSRRGHVHVRLPLAERPLVQAIGQQLLTRFKAASLGRGEWSVEVVAADRGWTLTNDQRDFFGWRVTLPLEKPGFDTTHSPGEIEDGIHEAIYGAMLAQAATGASLSIPPYIGNLHVSLIRVEEVLHDPQSGLTDLNHARFSANVVGGKNLFVGVDLNRGAGLIVRGK